MRLFSIELAIAKDAVQMTAAEGSKRRLMSIAISYWKAKTIAITTVFRTNDLIENFKLRLSVTFATSFDFARSSGLE